MCLLSTLAKNCIPLSTALVTSADKERVPASGPSDSKIT
jgi:hypothetical protein